MGGLQFRPEPPPSPPPPPPPPPPPQRYNPARDNILAFYEARHELMWETRRVRDENNARRAIAPVVTRNLLNVRAPEVPINIIDSIPSAVDRWTIQDEGLKYFSVIVSGINSAFDMRTLFSYIINGHGSGVNFEETLVQKTDGRRLVSMYPSKTDPYTKEARLSFSRQADANRFVDYFKSFENYGCKVRHLHKNRDIEFSEDCVFILGLPLESDEKYVMNLVPDKTTVKLKEYSKEDISFLPRKADKSHLCCYLQFKTKEAAQEFIKIWHRRKPPNGDRPLIVELKGSKKKNAQNGEKNQPIKPKITDKCTIWITGLPECADEDYIMALIDQFYTVATNDKGEPLCVIRMKGKNEKTCRLQFIANYYAESFIHRWNGKLAFGGTETLKISYFDEENLGTNTTVRAEQSRKRNDFDVTKHISTSEPSKAIWITGLPIWCHKEYIISLVNDPISIVVGDDREEMIRIFPSEKSEDHRNARITFGNSQKAEEFMNQWQQKIPPNSEKKLTVYFWHAKEIKTINRGEQSSRDGTIVFVSGLPLSADPEFVMALVEDRFQIKIDSKKKPDIYLFNSKAGKQFKSGKINFTTNEYAKKFIDKWDGKVPPGLKYRLNADFWSSEQPNRSQKRRNEREEKIERNLQVAERDESREQGAKEVKTIVQNVIYVKGLNKSWDEEQLLKMVKIYTKIGAVKATIYKNEKTNASKGVGVIIFKKAKDAQNCIDLMNGLDDGATLKLKMNLFQAKSKRQGGNGSLSQKEEVFSHNCIICFDIFEQRDMMGCVAIGKEETDLETHFLCHECVKDYCKSQQFEGKLGEGGTGLACGQPDCKRVYLWAPVRRLLGEEDIASRLDERLAKGALMDISGIEYCKEGCGFGAFLPQKEILQFFYCEKCRAHYCRICQISFKVHLEKSCDEVDPKRFADKQENFRMAKAEELLSAAKIRTCAKCGNRFTKDQDGSCNKMTCPTCGTKQCYICKKSDIGYDHFSNKGPCILFGDVDEIDKINYEKALREVEKNSEMRGAVNKLRGTNNPPATYNTVPSSYVEYY